MLNKFKESIYFKLAVIGFLVLILLIPASMVESLILDRESVQDYAIEEVSSKWGSKQSITGPFISIPYLKYDKRYNIKTKITETVRIRDWIYFLPEKLDVKGEIYPEKRKRGIFEVVLYNSKIDFNGFFPSLNLDLLEIEESSILFDQAKLNIGISDLKGIEKQVELKLNDKDLLFNSGISSGQVVESGINVAYPFSNKFSENLSFSTSIELKGSQYLYFTPVGKTTDVVLNSSWKSPSFIGAFLPDENKVNEKGFLANWNILNLNRNYPQVWKGSEFNLKNSEFGVDLLLTMNNYKKSYRVAKYAILFLVLTFTTFFFIEVLQKFLLHPIQYLLIGLALIIFFTLLVSFSEQIEFNFAYLVSSILTLGLVSSYTWAITNRKIAILIFGILSLLYLFIFIIIQLTDYALLMGSIGMFLILACVMYLSRKINWNELKNNNI